MYIHNFFIQNAVEVICCERRYNKAASLVTHYVRHHQGELLSMQCKTSAHFILLAGNKIVIRVNPWVELVQSTPTVLPENYQSFCGEFIDRIIVNRSKWL